MFGIVIFQSLFRDERGATAIEYGLIASMIVISAIVGMNAFANEANDMFTKVQTEVENAR